jgi:hypothetical protein
MHKAFAVSSIMLALCLLWMLGADYYREWRKYQSDFTKIDIKKTDADAQAALANVDQAKLEETKAALKADPRRGAGAE